MQKTAKRRVTDILPPMRVVAGRFRGRKLVAPAGLQTRPILDRVKVALFDWLGSRLAQPGALPPIAVLDLFCGGGSLGIEALSRGAVSCVFVDTSAAAIACLTQNIQSLKIDAAARILRCPAELLTLTHPGEGGADLIFIDPPYSLSDDLADDSIMSRIMKRLGNEVAVSPRALAIWRHSEQCELPEVFHGVWHSCRRRTWGNMAITVYEFSPQGPRP